MATTIVDVSDMSCPCSRSRGSRTRSY